jgi:hypothetical protein
MPTSISFSLGVSQLLYLALGAALVANGFPGLSYSVLESKNSNLMRFGAYLGSAVIIAYTGRHYYKNVIVSAFGRRRPQEIPLYATWAARGLGLSLLVAVVILHGSGLNWLLSALFVLLTMLLYLVMTRIAAETGTFFIQPWWAPAGIITALLGFEALGPTAFVMLGIASVILVVDPREALMPFIANGLKVVETAGGISPPKVAPWIAVVLVGGFVVSGAVTLFLQYNYGVSLSGNTWATEFIPTLAIDPLVRFLSSSAADGTLTSATSAGFWERVRAIHPIPGAIPWFSFGLALVIGASVARLRLPKWPLHPVAFLVWGTYPMVNFAPAFLLGSGIKAAVVSASGTKGYQAVRPLMVGVIAGELTTGLFWMLVGAAYFFITGKPPQSYVIFPG